MEKDHDLLIRVDTKLETLIGEVQLMRDNTNHRLGVVEQNKVDKQEFNDFKLSIQNELNKADLNFNKTLLERNQRYEEMFKSQDNRITRIERNMNMGIGVLVTLQIIVPIILKYVFRF